MSAGGEVLRELWQSLGGDSCALGRVDLTGQDPVLPSSYRVGTAAQVSIAAAGLAATELHRARGAPAERVAVDILHAATEFRSERYLRINGEPPPAAWDPLSGAYRCRDDRWVRIHANFPHHREAVLKLLHCRNDPGAVKQALSDWSADAFETAAARSGAVAAMMRRPEEWNALAQGRAVRQQPLISIERIGKTDPILPPTGERPLSGIRVLDLTRVVAGPVAGRTLAAHGADVLRLTAPHLPSVAPLVMDMGRGKRSAALDLSAPQGSKTLRSLLSDADVFLQSYRPTSLSRRGFSAAELAKMRPGIVCASLSAYGQKGPWRDRRGFDSIVQTANGINHAEASVSGTQIPKALPCQAQDHGSGYLLALGIMLALERRARAGGSYRVHVSLARTGEWLKEMGRLEDGIRCPEPDPLALARFMEESESGFGRLTAVAHSAILSNTPARFDRPSMPLGSSPPAWSDKPL